MPAGVNTKSNIGIRRFIYSLPTPEYRNFEVNGTQLYKVMCGAPLPTGGVFYQYSNQNYLQFQTVVYDGGTFYKNPAQIERDFSRGWLDPID